MANLDLSEGVFRQASRAAVFALIGLAAFFTTPGLAMADEVFRLQAASASNIAPVAPVAPVASASSAQAKVDCRCRVPGGDKAPLGARICVRIGGELQTMRCEMALNNTIWRKLSSGCDVEPVS